MKRALQTLTRAGNALVAAGAVACVAAVAVIALRVLEARLMNERREKIRATVESVHGVLVRFGELVERGELTVSEAQRRALETVRGLRYGESDYFWIQDQENRMLMHPILPGLEGRNMHEYKDANGKLFFQDFVRQATSPAGAGYVSYLWPRPGQREPVRKLSYVKSYAPWGWIIGSGTYLDDFDATMAADARRVYWAAGFVAMLLGGAGLVLTWSMQRAKRLELELQQSRKLEAVGQLAAGIAHEINTPIQYIGDNTHFLEDAFHDFEGLVQEYRRAARPEAQAKLAGVEEAVDLAYLCEQVPKTMARTLEGVQRVATIVRAMKEFAHPDQREMVAADINRALQATLEVARNEVKYVADVETDFGEIPPVTCHPGDLNQVFLNVAVNAAHAIGDVVKGSDRRGKIRVSTRRDGLDVVVAISDTGGGIPEAIRDKVFDPFFTTKEVGRGTGQGLAIARNILRKHRGAITFDTRPGEGTTFFIRFPIEGRREKTRAAVGCRRPAG